MIEKLEKQQQKENANMTSDRNKGISSSMTYNVMNLPQQVTFSNGRTVSYVYGYDGTKLQTVHTTSLPQTSVTTTYCGNLIYENGSLRQMLVEGGYVTFNGSTPVYHFHIQDHLGNNRVVAGADGTVEQVNHYYPYGGLMADISTGSDVQRYKYNGKELDRMHGLDWYDYGVRHYDAAMGRWPTMDKLAEENPEVSPYVYCANNPINRFDPDGMDWYQNNSTRYYTWYDGDIEHVGYSHIGGKGSVLGEFEGIIDNILCSEEGLNMESLYSNGFTFDISPNDKGALISSKERGWDFFDEFINGTGPEFSVILDEHPYTKMLKNYSYIIQQQEDVRKHNKKTNVKSKDFRPWHAPLNSPLQFIGTFRYDGYVSRDGKMINNVVFDYKNNKSLFYHLPLISNHRRSEKKNFGNTYQFYIWKSKK